MTFCAMRGFSFSRTSARSFTFSARSASSWSESVSRRSLLRMRDFFACSRFRSLWQGIYVLRIVHPTAGVKNEYLRSIFCDSVKSCESGWMLKRKPVPKQSFKHIKKIKSIWRISISPTVTTGAISAAVIVARGCARYCVGGRRKQVCFFYFTRSSPLVRKTKILIIIVCVWKSN